MALRGLTSKKPCPAYLKKEPSQSKIWALAKWSMSMCSKQVQSTLHLSQLNSSKTHVPEPVNTHTDLRLPCAISTQLAYYAQTKRLPQRILENPSQPAYNCCCPCQGMPPPLFPSVAPLAAAPVSAAAPAAAAAAAESCTCAPAGPNPAAAGAATSCSMAMRLVACKVQLVAIT